MIGGITHRTRGFACLPRVQERSMGGVVGRFLRAECGWMNFGDVRDVGPERTGLGEIRIVWGARPASIRR